VSWGWITALALYFIGGCFTGISIPDDLDEDEEAMKFVWPLIWPVLAIFEIAQWLRGRS